MSSTKRGWPSGAGRADPQTPALADREAVGARRGVPEHLAGASSTMSPAVVGRTVAELLAQPARRCRRRRRSRCRGCRACRRRAGRAPRASARTSALAVSPSGNIECASCSWVEHAEHVGLVLAVVDGAVQLDQPVRAGARAGRSGRSPRRRSPAPSARSSTAANLIFSLQRRHGLGVRPAAYSPMKSSTTSSWKRSREVPDVERDADHVGGPAGVVGVLDGAAAPRAGPVRRGVARQRQVDAGDVVARRRPRGQRRPPSRRRRTSRRATRIRLVPGGPWSRARRAGALDDRADRLGEGVDVGRRWWCGRARSAARTRANSSAQPIASSTWEGWGTPAEQADPVEHSMPRASSSISSESPSQPGNVEVGVAGEASRPDRVPVVDRVGHDRDVRRRTSSSRSAASRAAQLGLVP